MQMWKIVGNQTDLRSSELVKISARTEPCSRSESELCKLWCISSFLSEIILHVATVNGSVGYFCDVPLGLLRQYCNVKWKANVCWLKALQRTVPAAGRHLAMRQHLSVSGAAQWDSLAMQGMQMLSPRAFFVVVKVTVTVVLWARGHSRKTTLLLTSHIFIMGQSRILTSALRLHSQHTRQKAEGWKPKWPTTDTQV